MQYKLSLNCKLAQSLLQSKESKHSENKLVWVGVKHDDCCFSTTARNVTSWSDVPCMTCLGIGSGDVADVLQHCCQNHCQKFGVMYHEWLVPALLLGMLQMFWSITATAIDMASWSDVQWLTVLLAQVLGMWQMWSILADCCFSITAGDVASVSATSAPPACWSCLACASSTLCDTATSASISQRRRMSSLTDIWKCSWMASNLCTECMTSVSDSESGLFWLSDLCNTQSSIISITDYSALVSGSLILTLQSPHLEQSPSRLFSSFVNKLKIFIFRYFS